MKKYKNSELDKKLLGSYVTLFGFVHEIRRFKNKTFIDLRDSSGIVQVLINDSRKINKESIIEVGGIVTLRANPNLQLQNGDIEIVADKLNVISECKDQLPFDINKDDFVREELRLGYRYLELRRHKYKEIFKFRHKLNLLIRQFMDSEGFLEIDTPILSKSTPEGARDFLVITHSHEGFYALPQSPQIYKQLLMSAGFERYFQIAKVFRDEDLRRDRQPEFTQLDIEQAFVDEDDIQQLIERMFLHLAKALNFSASSPFPRMTYAHAMKYYGTDKPDTRFNYLLTDITCDVRHTRMLGEQRRAVAIFFDRSIEESQQILLREIASKNGCPMLYFLEVDCNSSSLLTKASLSTLISLGLNMSEGMINRIRIHNAKTLVLAYDREHVVRKGLGAVRVELAHMFSLVDSNDLNFL